MEAMKLGQCGCTIHEDRGEPCGYTGPSSDYMDPLSQVCDTCLRVCWGAALDATPEPASYVEYRTTACHAGSDGDCDWVECPQLRDGEPRATGRHCPLDAEPRKPWSPAVSGVDREEEP